MIYIYTFLAGYWTCWIIERAARAWLRARRKPVAPTLHRRRQHRDRPEQIGEPIRGGEQIDCVRYEFINLTGLEEQ